MLRFLFKWKERWLHVAKAWVTDQSSFQVVKDAWESNIRGGMEAHKMSCRFAATCRVLKLWNKRHFGMVSLRIKELKEELKHVHANNLGDREVVIQNELHTQRSRMKSILRQKSRKVWLAEGDQNSQFFFSIVLLRRKRNRIWAIKSGQGWLRDKMQIEDYFL